jgi:hypothetical protein
MSVIFFEGFNRPNKPDGHLWSLYGDTSWGNSSLRGHDGALALQPEDTDESMGVNAARATFPKRAQIPAPSNAIRDIGTAVTTPPITNLDGITDSASLIIGFCLNGGSLIAEPTDRKIFTVFSGNGSVACTFELAASEQDPVEVSLVPERLNLLIKQNNTTVATFFIPDDVGPITFNQLSKNGNITGYGKTMGSAFLNRGGYFFELTFLQEANLLEIHVNGLQLLTNTGASQAAITVSSIGGFGFHSSSYGITVVDDFYVAESSNRLGMNTHVISLTPADGYNLLDRETPSAWKYNNVPLNSASESAVAGALASDDGDESVLSTNAHNALAEFSFDITNELSSWNSGDNAAIGTIACVRVGVTARKDGRGQCGVQLMFKTDTAPIGEDESVHISPILALRGWYETSVTEFLPYWSEYPLPPGGALGLWQLSDFTTASERGFGIRFVDFAEEF